jgi:hypothetical protein
MILMNCLSKVFSLYARLEWGLSDVKITTPIFFSAKNKEMKDIEFMCVMQDHKDATIDLPVFNDILLMLIPNKKGDNFIVLDQKGCKKMMGRNVTFKELADAIRRKTRFEVTTDILHDS